MIKKLLFVNFLFLFPIFFPFETFADTSILIENSLSNNTASAFVCNTANVYQQTFKTLSNQYDITSIALASYSTGGATTTHYLRIGTGTTTNWIATSTGITNRYPAWYNFQFSNLTVSPNTTYNFSVCSLANGFPNATTQNFYPDGARILNGTPVDSDFSFKVYGTSSSTCEQCETCSDTATSTCSPIFLGTNHINLISNYIYLGIFVTLLGALILANYYEHSS